MPTSESTSEIRPYQIFMLVLSVWALVALAGSTFLPLSEGTRVILNTGDLVICVIFFIDFVASLVRAPDRMKYFVTWGWIDLLSSIPVVDSLRLGRAARVLRILRVLRAVKSARTIGHFIIRRAAESAALASLLMCVLVLMIGSIAILEIESRAGGNIRTAHDAMWWVIVTMTTVGYGDLYPITLEGRLVATVLMAVGIGAFSVMSGLFAASFLARFRREEESELADIRRTLARIEARQLGE